MKLLKCMNNEILLYYKLIESEFKKLFPSKEYTIITTVWNDSDFKITAQHGDDNNIIHYLTYLSSKKTIEYYTYNGVDVGAIKIGRDGKEYYVPNELVKYLNESNKNNL